MSKLRREPCAPKGRAPSGNFYCSCGCGKECIPPRQTWATKDCYPRWALINDPGAIRQAVFDRDLGVCALCRLDTEWFEDELKTLSNLLFKLKLNNGITFEQIGSMVDDFLKERGLSHWRNEIRTPLYGTVDWRHLWEADHIVPVIEGGGQTGLENFRTACLQCHKEQTRLLARRRAEQRKNHKDQIKLL